MGLRDFAVARNPVGVDFHARPHFLPSSEGGGIFRGKMTEGEIKFARTNGDAQPRRGG